jgi:hypothetical protein
VNGRPIAILLALAGLVLPDVAAVAQERPQQRLYRWVDRDGVVRYGDRIPPEYANVDRDILNDQAVAVGFEEGEITPEEQAELDRRRAIEEAEQLARDNAARRDRMLLETYITVEDIEDLRDRRLELLSAQIKVTELYVANLRKRLASLEREASVYKPYSDKENAPPVPEDLALEMQRALASISLYEQTLCCVRAGHRPLQGAQEALTRARMPEAAGASGTFLEARDHGELELHDRDDDELRDALTGFDPKRRRSAIPARDLELALIVRIDQTDEIPEHDSVLVAEA